MQRGLESLEPPYSEGPESPKTPEEDAALGTETAAQGGDHETQETPSHVDQVALLHKQIEDLKHSAQLQQDMYLRKSADFDNFKKRLTKEHEEFSKYALEKIVTELLPVIDGLEMSLAHVGDKNDPIASGVLLVLKQFIDALEKHGVKQIAGVGEAYDPHSQEAIGVQKVEGALPEQVVAVHRKGYLLNGKVLRAALVTISE